jgi:hypothetical protein
VILRPFALLTCADTDVIVPEPLAGCTPYSLHSAEATAHEAKEFHLQQVHKPLPDKVSMHMPQPQLTAIGDVPC